jgi:hypothetical protein
MRNRWLQDYIGTSSEQSVRRLWNGHSLLTWSHSGNASSEGRCRRPGHSCGAIISRDDDQTRPEPVSLLSCLQAIIRRLAAAVSERPTHRAREAAAGEPRSVGYGSGTAGWIRQFNFIRRGFPKGHWPKPLDLFALAVIWDGPQEFLDASIPCVAFAITAGRRPVTQSQPHSRSCRKRMRRGAMNPE